MDDQTKAREAFIQNTVLAEIIQYQFAADRLPAALGGGALWDATPRYILLILFRKKEATEFSTDSRLRTFEGFYDHYLHFSRLADNFLGKQYKVKTLILDAQPSCLIGAMEKLEAVELVEAVKEFQEVLYEETSIRYSAYLGDTIKPPEDIHAAYLSAKYLIQYDEIMQTGREVLIPTDIRWRQSDATDIPTVEQKYQNSIHMRDFKKASALALKLLSLETDASATYCITLKDRVISRVDAALDSMHLAYDGSSQSDITPLVYFEEILHAKNLQEFRTLLPLFFDALDEYASGLVKTDNRRVVKFIEQNFRDPGLCTEMVCSEFNISYHKLSGILDEYAGVGMIDFVHRLRLAEVKRLLETTDEKIDVIAKDVGYLTARTLNRAFLRYEQTTPREYRRLIISRDKQNNN